MAFATNLTGTLIIDDFSVDGQPLGIRNNYGNIRGAGTIADTGLATTSTKNGAMFGETDASWLVTTIVSGAGPVEGAITTAGASFNSGLQTMMITQQRIANIVNTELQGGHSDSANRALTPLQLDILRTYYYKVAVKQGNWNIFNGSFSSISNSAQSGAWNISLGADSSLGMIASGTDVAANPQQDAPGRIVIRDGSPNPVQTGYQPRYNW